MRNLLPLRLALAGNAAFSFSSGALMVASPATVGNWLGYPSPYVYTVMGIGLILFAAELIYQATRDRLPTWRSLIASFADFSWVLGSIALLLFFPHLFSTLGVLMIVSVAFVVLGFGIAQVFGIDRAHRVGTVNVYRHCIMMETAASASRMWKVIEDMGGISKYMPSLVHSEILNGETPGVGAVRFCRDNAGRQWSKECIDFKPHRGYTLRFHSEAPDFPYPASSMVGGWEIHPIGLGSRVMVWWELTPKSPLLAPMLMPILAFQADRDFSKVIDRMADEAIRASGQAKVTLGARLLPKLC